MRDIKLICLAFGLDVETVNKYLLGNVAPKTKKREYKT